LVYRKTREKILLHKINKTTEKVKNSGRIDDTVLEDLYQANNYALENQYRKSREILEDIQGKIKSENRNN
jgi:hypothetical protein